MNKRCKKKKIKKSHKRINIYTINVCERLEVDDKGWPDCGSLRTVGYYTDREYAIKAVEMNMCDIYEMCYNYAIIEKVEEGLYNPSIDTLFFKYDISTDTYKKISKPEFMEHFCGFSIG